MKNIFNSLKAKKTGVVFLLFLISTLSMFGQRTIRGTVVSAGENEPLIGATVTLSGTTMGTITDVNGEFSIEADNDDILLVSYIGYQTREIPVGDRTVIEIMLEEETELLDEVVVIGYGTTRRKDLTSAITTVNSEEIVKSPSGQAMQALQGKVAGMQVVSAGAPGASPTVRVRGIGSFPTVSNSSPLYVVDGMYFDNIDFLNPNDIESLSVLKDASASAIYGVRAANGVVLISTKGGSLNTQSTVTYEGYIGTQVPQNVLKMANAEQFVKYVNQTGDPADISFVQNAMQRYGRSRLNPDVPDVNTDWYAEIMKPYAVQQNHSLSASGGNDKTAYSIGLGYFDQEGLLETDNSYQRLNLRTKVDHQVNRWLKTGVNFNLSNSRRYIGSDAAWFSAYHAVPILPVYDDQNYNELVDAGFDYPSRLTSAQILGYRGSQNPLIPLEFNNRRNDSREMLSGAYAEISFIPEKLTLRTSYNVALFFIKGRNVGLPYYITTNTNRDVSTISSSRTTEVNQFLDNTLTYEESFGDHNLSAMVGTSYRDEWWDYLSASATDIPLSENSWYIGQTRVSESIVADDAAERLYGMSYFGRLSYNFQRKYIAYFTLRQEGTSKYQEKWGTFPAFGLGWVVSEESFLQDVDFINFLKIRGGWGKLGNDKIQRQDGANTTNPVYLAINDTRVNGTQTTSTFGYLAWETVAGTNVGITSTLFNNRLNLEADYYIRDTENAAIPISLKLQPGSVLRNVGSIRNSGLEMSLTWNGEITDDLRFTLSGQFATLKNEVLDLYGQEYINGGQGEFRQRSAVGEPLMAFYGYEVDGIYQNTSEIESDSTAILNGLIPGDFKFKDQNDDGIVNDDDKVFLGSYLPTLTYGGLIGLSYKNFDFSMNFMGQTGNKILNRKRGEIIWTNDTNFDSELLSNLWEGEGTSDRYPSAAAMRKGWNQNFSDFLVEDGSYFRIQNIQLAYTINGDNFLSGNMPDVRVTLTAERPLTLFEYNGFNPDIPDGIDRQYYPVGAIYTFGLNIKF